MAPNPRVARAFRAMKDLGIAEDKVKPVLKNLLKAYEKNWEPIEEENYRVLLDAIFETEEAEAAVKKKSVSDERDHEEDEEAQEQDELQRPLKRLRLKYHDGQSSQSPDNSLSHLAATSLKPPKDEPVELPDVSASQELQHMEGIRELCSGDMMTDIRHDTSQLFDRNNKRPVSPENMLIQGSSDPSDNYSVDKNPSDSRRTENDAISHSLHLKNMGKETPSPQVYYRAKSSASEESSLEVLHKGQWKDSKAKISCTQALINPREDPVPGDLIQLEIPITIVLPERINEGGSPTREQDRRAMVVSDATAREDEFDGFNATSINNGTGSGRELAEVAAESHSTLQIASSSSGEVKLCLSCPSLGRSGFHLPDIDTVVKLVEDRCLRSYKILDPNFSVMKLMQDMCECFLQLGSEKLDEQTQNHRKIDPSRISSSVNPSLATDLPLDSVHGLLNAQHEADATLPISIQLPPSLNVVDGTLQPHENGCETNKACMDIDEDGVDDANSLSLVVVQEQQLAPDHICSSQDVIDVCKGHERVVISLMNGVNDEKPPSFHYIPKNVVFQNAYVNFSLARIGNDNCCSSCSGDCLSLSTPCACAHETGGEFAYTPDGLVKEEFLEECVSMNRDPEKHCQYFCKECPLERSKNEESTEPCRGHLVRRFIKECWWKCGCDKQCGNRVVQRGITRNLQVFMTKGKGWGLRTLDDLPKGAFVCEYVGEVLTNAELFDRVSRSPKGEEHSYPVLLDADWGSEGVLKDEDALCLDATYYGNVARFINHRCFDSTLVEIPVEIETPDHHYYHLAFFTSRKVKAMEELTWDYGIDFDDLDHPVKAFRCQCGSRFCRSMKRRRRSRFSRR